MQQEMQQMMLMNNRRQSGSNNNPQRQEYQRIMRDMQRQVNMIQGNIHNAQRGLPSGTVGPDDGSNGGDNKIRTFRGNTNNSFVTEEALQALALLPKNSQLYKIQMQHLEAVTKLKFQMEELAQQQELQQMKHDVKRRNQEHEKEIEHEAFMAEKRRQLRAARIQRILAKEMPGDAITTGFSTEYDPNKGFTIFFDFVIYA